MSYLCCAAVVELCQRIVATSGVMDMIHEWRVEDKTVSGVKDGKATTGRPREMPMESALAVWLLCALLGRPHHYTEMGRIIAHEFSSKNYAVLGLNGIYFDTLDNNVVAKVEKRWMNRIHAAIDDIRGCIEPYPQVPRNRRLTQAEFKKIKASLDPEFVEERKRRGIQFANRLVWETVQELGEEYLA